MVASTFSIPDGPKIKLGLPPRVESWNRHDDPEQVALRAFVAHVHQLITPTLESTEGLFALRLDADTPIRRVTTPATASCCPRRRWRVAGANLSQLSEERNCQLLHERGDGGGGLRGDVTL